MKSPSWGWKCRTMRNLFRSGHGSYMHASRRRQPLPPDDRPLSEGDWNGERSEAREKFRNAHKAPPVRIPTFTRPRRYPTDVPITFPQKGHADRSPNCQQIGTECALHSSLLSISTTLLLLSAFQDF